jgi:WD40 repeat protein
MAMKHRTTWRRQALAFSIFMSMLATGCGNGAARVPTKPTATTRARVTWAPGTWKAAYLARDGHVHFVTFDGKQDSTGPVLPGLDSMYLEFASAGVDPNGHTLAYDAIYLNLVDVTAPQATPRTLNLGALYDMAWSMDGALVAVGDRDGHFKLINASTGDNSDVVVAPQEHARGLVGWIDSTHLAVEAFQGTTFYTDSVGETFGTSVTLGSVDITTGAFRNLVTIQSNGLGSSRFTISPDGSKVLFSNAPLRDAPYTPLIQVIDTASGSVSSLPRIAATPKGGLTSVAWRPGTQTLAAATGFGANGDFQAWLLDLKLDTATRFTTHDLFSAGWSPDGRVLIMSTGEGRAIGSGPFDLTATTFDDSEQPHTVLLTHAAMSFPFVGFVRTE